MFEQNKDITSLTTFGIPAKAALYAEYSSVRELIALSRKEEFINNEVLHIGGGSNLLFVNDFNGLVLHSAIKGFTRYDKDLQTTFVIVGAGEKWSDFVDWCVNQGLGGVENLAGIPGEVGAAPVQNVGAYGLEAKDVIFSVECFDTVTRQVVRFNNEECQFGYRDSRFKHDWKGRYFVLRVSFLLHSDNSAHNLLYGPLKKLESQLGHKPSIKEVADAVIAIRNEKLPDPKHIGSAGSFFKNPVVNRYYYEQQILGLNPDVPCYPRRELVDGSIKYFDDNGDEIKPSHVKIPAGWLIEHCGLKGLKMGGAIVYSKQCLVIANNSDASAEDVVLLAEKVVHTVRRKTGVTLLPEVNYIDSSIEVTILGSGTSKGVPEVACDCEICRSPFVKDKRQRASAMVKTHGMTIMIDISPDFRQQALSNDISHIDAVLLTHSHYDHVGGIDDLRPYCADFDVPIYLKADVNSDLHKRLDYCFRPHPYPGVPTFQMNEINKEPFFINGLKIIPVTVMHGKLPILGYRIGDFAYITDAKTIAEDEMEKLSGLKVLVINALREREHFAHLSFAEALDIIGILKPKEAYLTHFNHEVGFHHDLENRFGPHIHPCYDGLKIVIK